MVETIMRQIDPNVPYRGVHATRAKVARAEPIAALYEQGRVHHVHNLNELEAQMTQMTTKGFRGRGSPDRVDALVWALHDLVIVPGRNQMMPQIRNV
jgi:phage terminase large subunit-like protein